MLNNYLRYYILPSGGVFYRGLEMAQSARILTNIAQYYEYTRDAKPLLRFLPKIKAVFGLLLKRRSVQRAHLTPQAHPGSLYRCRKSTKERPVVTAGGQRA